MVFAGLWPHRLDHSQDSGTRRVPNPDWLGWLPGHRDREVPDESAQGFAPGCACALVPNVTKTALTSVGTGSGSGCACTPNYVFSRDRDGRPVKGARVKDRKTAERALAAAQREIDEGRVGIAKPKNITFSEWADVFEEILDTRIASGELHPRTKSSCASTLKWPQGVRLSLPPEIGNPELRRFLERFTRLKPASRLRYLRELSACLAVAVADRYLDVGDRPLLTTRVTVAPLASRIFPLGRWSRTVANGRLDVVRITAPSEQ